MPAEFIKQIKAVHLPILVLFLLVTIGKVVAPTARVIYQKLRHDLETNTDPDVRAFLGLVLPGPARASLEALLRAGWSLRRLSAGTSPASSRKRRALKREEPVVRVVAPRASK